MGDLHSIAFCSSLHNPSLGLDFNNLGVCDADMSQCSLENSSAGSTPPFLETADFPTGYLQDVLFEFNSKRRRLLLFPDQAQTKDAVNNSIMGCRTSDFIKNCCGNFSTVSGANDEKGRKKRAFARVVHPFAVVKPGGFDGESTLKDINERISMPPIRVVRHPVGDFACRPLVMSPDRPGLSGKAVVGFTKIHTQGRGTITIIRTKK